MRTILGAATIVAILASAVPASAQYYYNPPGPQYPPVGAGPQYPSFPGGNGGVTLPPITILPSGGYQPPGWQGGQSQGSPGYYPGDYRLPPAMTRGEPVWHPGHRYQVDCTITPNDGSRPFNVPVGHPDCPRR